MRGGRRGRGAGEVGEWMSGGVVGNGAGCVVVVTGTGEVRGVGGGRSRGG